MSSAIPASELISNLASAQQSLTAAAANEAKWSQEHLEATRRLALLIQDGQKYHDEVKEAKKHVEAANAALAGFYRSDAPLDAGYVSPAELPSSPQIPATPFKKRYTKEEKKEMSPADRKAIKQFKDAAAAIRKANRTPEEQEVINARVTKMKAARLAKKAAGGSVDGSEAEGATA
jgi:hypothetical protein